MSEAIQPRMIDFKPHEIPLEDFDISQRELWSEDLKMAYFERLREEAPVHYCKDSSLGLIGRSRATQTLWKSTQIGRTFPRTGDHHH